MRKEFFFIAAVSALAVLAAGCAPPFSRGLLQKVDRTLSFSEIRNDPGRYRGTWVMLGGMIVDVKNTKEGSFLEILQKPLSRDGRPVRTDRTEGRFIGTSDQYLDAAVYQPGREITIIGEVEGQKTQRLGEIDYQYTLLAVKELHLWEPYAGPRFSIGVGVGVFHGY